MRISSVASPAAILACALCAVLATARSSAAQSPAMASGSVYFDAAIGFQRNGEPAQTSGCPSRGNAGVFCGSASGTSPAAITSVGIVVVRHVGLEVEGSLARGRTGTASHDALSHSDTVITRASFEHTGDRSVSALLRIQIGAGHGLSIEPVIGAVRAHTTDRLADQVRVVTIPPFFTKTEFPADEVTSRSAPGFSIGADIVSPPRRGVSWVGSARIRWIHWPAREHYYPPVIPADVPVSVGRWSLTVGAGLRWAHR